MLDKASAYESLKPQHRKFVDAYLRTNNVTQAATEAGYGGNANSAGVQGSRLRRNPKIRAAIDEWLQEHTESANEVIYALTEQARANVANFFTFDEAGLPRVDTEYLRAHGHLVKKIKVKTGEVEIELYDGQNAHIQIGRFWGLFKDKTEVGGPNGGPVEVVLRVVRDKPRTTDPSA